MGAFGGPEKDREFCSGESVLVHSVVAIASAASVVSIGATLVVSTLQGSFCFGVSGVVLVPADFVADGFPHLVCCPLWPTVGGFDSRMLLR